MSAHDQVAVSQYRSWFTDQVSHGKNWTIPFVQLPDMV